MLFVSLNILKNSESNLTVQKLLFKLENMNVKYAQRIYKKLLLRKSMNLIAAKCAEKSKFLTSIE